MTHLNVIFKETEDNTPAWSDLNDKNSVDADIESVCILERGTVSGKCVLGFKIKLPDGTFAVAQLTENLFNMINQGLKGFNERINDKKANKN